MKRSVYTLCMLLILPLLFVACGDKDLDRSLDGTWIGEVETSDLNVLSAMRNNQKTDAKALKETLVYKIDGKSIQTFRSKNYQTMDNQGEVEIGTYRKSKDVINFEIDRLSCAKLDPTRPVIRKISYKFSSDLTSLIMTFGANKYVTFKRLDKDEASSMDQMVQSAATGCFSSDGSFKQGKIEKPAPLDVAQKVDELESETNKELNTADETVNR